MARVVMVTGVARHLGARVARLLADDPGVDRVVGVDVFPPSEQIGAAEFVRADIRNPVVARLIERAEVDTVVHMNVLASPADAGGRAPQKEINVIGTMQLLAACQQAASVTRLVVKSSSAVYGAGPRDPALFTEAMSPRTPPRSGFGKDAAEVESYVQGFARRRPDVDIALLRFANVIGPEIVTSMTRFFALPVVPLVLGHDPRLQFVHEADCVAALRHAVLGSAAGTFNVAGDGFLLLGQAAHRAGRPTVGVPGYGLVLARLLRRAGVSDVSAEQIRFLTYGRGLDTTAMRTTLGFSPEHSSAAAFDSYVAATGGGGLLDRQRVARWEARARGVLDRVGVGG